MSKESTARAELENKELKTKIEKLKSENVDAGRSKASEFCLAAKSCIRS